ncbi:thioesterase II family protein [Streptomyces caniscabiei]|uniref:Thioesterase n=1 Tax=Streptomyces caniscabiei TaxID=2746961 RepID=A0A927QEI4_9ACTN|nr:alpha/beta fold hydrolase [Streptomyces caniscabiei]MBD9723943.1 thioesterase [Streptomyces caniscabiei]MDX3511403.1 alpha/beta fold hydrolase [Streptomyces caniscabiei]MDX3718416.1 alpha/beta fold hydrolase [Streptomyces caniscabiei]MDX3727067.1 alpha/beta fold hydrolase [Streptomyces caniscabiei]WEO22174.1 alpha/beta fold hydrolase [Streptomyces caniscabiei]
MTSAVNSGPWLRNYRPAPDAPVRLLCLPHAGGSASAYHPMALALAPAADVLAAQYPGRQDRYAEPPASSVRELAERIAEAVSGDDDRPLALFGHSMGALVAYEVALALQTAGRPPARLFVSGRRAPSTPWTGPRLHLGSDAELLRAVRRLGGTDGQVFEDEELVQLVLPALRGDYRALETYEPRPDDRLSCPLTVLTGDADPVTPVADARAWAGHTDGPTELCVFPGGHFYLNERPEEVVGVVRRHLGL